MDVRSRRLRSPNPPSTPIPFRNGRRETCAIIRYLSALSVVPIIRDYQPDLGVCRTEKTNVLEA